MIRIGLVRVLIFLVPFALYEIYRVIAQRTRPRPWPALFIAGLALVAASFVYVGLTEGETTSGRYVPPHMEAGKLIPGHVEPASAVKWRGKPVFVPRQKAKDKVP